MRHRNNLPVLAVANPAPNAAAPPPLEAAIPQEFAKPGLSMMQIFSILRAYWLASAIIVLTVSVAMGVALKLMPKTYTATCTLLVSGENSDPLATSQQGAATPLFNFMSTESQLMVSPEVLLPVIDQLHLAADKHYTAGYSGDGSNLREWIRENLAKDLEIQLGAFGSQLISITASASNAPLAAQIANTVADVYLTQQRQRLSGPASERAQRYSHELAELKEKVKLAQDQVTAFRQRTGVTDTTEKNNNIEETLLGSLEARLQDAANARRAAEVKAASESNPNAGGTSLVAQNLKQLLTAQQSQLAQLSTTLGSQHPKVLELQSQIRANQQSLDEEMHSVNSGTSTELVAARQLEAKTRAAVEEQRNKVLGVNKLQDEGTKYELELESAQSVYKRALDGYDQIMFASGGQGTNVSVVSSAVPPQKAAKPNKFKLFIIGIFAGIAVGVLAPLLYELLVNRRVRCRDDFERDFSLPVLMEFDQIDAVGGMT